MKKKKITQVFERAIFFKLIIYINLSEIKLYIEESILIGE